jgi:hypothetical protein
MNKSHLKAKKASEQSEYTLGVVGYAISNE